MGSLSRNKGRSGEQEIVRILKDELGLGIAVTRNYAQQAHTGGVDVLGVPGWAIEVKRAKQFSEGWWPQSKPRVSAISQCFCTGWIARGGALSAVAVLLVCTTFSLKWT